MDWHRLRLPRRQHPLQATAGDRLARAQLRQQRDAHPGDGKPLQQTGAVRHKRPANGDRLRCAECRQSPYLPAAGDSGAPCARR